MFAVVASNTVTLLAESLSDPDMVAAIAGPFEAVIDVTALDPQPQIGWSYDGTTFTAPEEPLA